MKQLHIGPKVSRLLNFYSVDRPMLAAHLGLSNGELIDLLLQDDIGALHLLRISEAIGVDLFPKLSSQLNTEALIAKGPQLAMSGL